MSERFEVFESATTRLKQGRAWAENTRRWSVWERDGSDDGRLVAENMTAKDATTKEAK